MLGAAYLCKANIMYVTMSNFMCPMANPVFYKVVSSRMKHLGYELSTVLFFRTIPFMRMRQSDSMSVTTFAPVFFSRERCCKKLPSPN